MLLAEQQMKNLIFIIVITCGFIAPTFAKDTYVKGYTRSNGVHVRGHYKSHKNSTKRDNFTTRGNVNPYTGKKGTRSPYKYYQPKKR